MDFHNFDCDSEATAQACIDAGSFPPQVLNTRYKQDTYLECANSVRLGDVLVLSAWRRTRAEAFAVGLVTRAAERFQDHAVRWVKTPGLLLQKSGGGFGGQWVHETAFTFHDEAAVGMGLEQWRARLTADESTQAKRAAVLASMVDMGYTDARLREMPTVCDILGCLMDEGFDVFPSGKSEGSGYVQAKGTIRVRSGAVDVAYVPGGNYPRKQLIGLAYVQGGIGQQPVPDWFDDAALRDWAIDLAIDPDDLMLHRAGSRYIRVTDAEAAVAAIRALARRHDEHYVEPEGSGRDEKLARDEEQIRQQYAHDLAKRDSMLKARRGQGKYRTALLRRFGGRCAVSGLAMHQVLRASHVLAWSLCKTEAQKIDPDNGLLLSADLDALFDRYLISFDRDGKLMCSPELDGYMDHHWPLGNLLRRPTEKQYAYLSLHNKTFWQLAARATRLKRPPAK